MQLPDDDKEIVPAPVEEHTGSDEQQYCFPEIGVAVRAKSLEDALQKVRERN